jgi:hypothetical protein
MDQCAKLRTTAIDRSRAGSAVNGLTPAIEVVALLLHYGQRDQRYRQVEDLLLVFDEIDDVFSTVGLLWRPIVSFLAAVAMFVATGFIFLTNPLAAEMLAVGLVSLGLLEMLRQRHIGSSNLRTVERNNASPQIPT